MKEFILRWKMNRCKLIFHLLLTTNGLRVMRFKNGRIYPSTIKDIVGVKGSMIIRTYFNSKLVSQVLHQNN